MEAFYLVVYLYVIDGILMFILLFCINWLLLQMFLFYLCSVHGNVVLFMKVEFVLVMFFISFVLSLAEPVRDN